MKKQNKTEHAGTDTIYNLHMYVYNAAFIWTNFFFPHKKKYLTDCSSFLAISLIIIMF